MSRVSAYPDPPGGNPVWSSSRPFYPQWQVCPVCEGRGTVAVDFYEQLGAATSTERPVCRTCNGRTILAPPGFFGGPRAADERRGER